jgi:hypothetical protein
MFKITSTEIEDQLLAIISNQIESEKENDYPEGFTPYIKLVEVDNFSELVLTVLNTDTEETEQFLIKVERKA